jgi:hypothetical protein
MKTEGAWSKACVLGVALCLLAAAPARPQAASGKPNEQSGATEARPAATSNKKRPKLAEITRVSTEEAAQGVARQKATPGGDASNTETDETAPPAVTELKPTARSSEASGGSVTVKDSKSSKASKVHGRMYGSLDPKNSGDRQDGAAVGAGSKNGKTSIYIETEGSRGATPPNR